MINQATVAGDVVRHSDGRKALVMFWTDTKQGSEACLAIRTTPDGQYNRAYFPLKYFQEHFSFVGRFEA